MTGSKKPVTLWCFSPAVMLGTFTLEFGLALWVVLRFGLNSQISRLVFAMLIALGVFQLAEYQVCTTEAVFGWTVLGIVAITLLPALGIDLIGRLTSWSRPIVLIGYLLAVAFSLAFLLPNLTLGSSCGGNYVLLHLQPSLSNLWGIYYFGYLFLGLGQLANHLRYNQKTNPGQREAQLWLLVGYLSFLLPMGVVYLVSPEARAAVPSIMCGFAAVLAVILALRVLPAAEAETKKTIVKSVKSS